MYAYDKTILGNILLTIKQILTGGTVYKFVLVGENPIKTKT